MILLGAFVPWIGAITFGRHVFTKHAKLTEYMINHEECHVKQYAKYGFFGFLRRYIWECIKHGYRNCKFEVEARNYGTLPKAVRDTYKVIT